ARRPTGLPDRGTPARTGGTARRRAGAGNHGGVQAMAVSDGFLDPDRLLPVDPATRRIARDRYESGRDLAIVSPHGHTEPAWFADDRPFEDAAALLVIPDHYVLRMLRSIGVSNDALGVARRDGGAVAGSREVWRTFARHYHLFDGTPS